MNDSPLLLSTPQYGWLSLKGCALLSLREDVVAGTTDRALTGLEAHRLSCLCDGFNAARPSILGRRVLQGELIAAVRAPSMTGAFRPARLVVIAGLPRAGTTLFHHLAAGVPGVWTLPMWSARRPFEPVDSARRDTDDYLRMLETVAPAVMRLHPMTVDGPDECATARQVTLLSERFWYLGAGTEYLELVEQDPAHVWAEWFGLLGVLAPAGATVVLKDPSHLGRWQHLPDLGIPTTVIRLWRDPDTAARSFSTLVAALRSMCRDEPVAPASVHPEVAAWLARRLAHELTLPTPAHVHVLDLTMGQLLDDPSAVVAAALRAAGVDVIEAPQAPPALRPSPAPSPSAWSALAPAIDAVFAAATRDLIPSEVPCA